MLRTLVYTGGKNPFENISGFVAMVKRERPGITSDGINQTVARQLAARKPRNPYVIHQMLGADILTGDLESVPAWPYLGPSTKAEIQRYPVATGERLDELNVTNQIQLVTGRVRETVNRSALISPRGLQQTYVWSQATGWTQQVTANDYDLILASPKGRMFRDPDRHGEHVEVRAHDVPITATYAFDSMDEAVRFDEDRKRHPHFAGVTIE